MIERLASSVISYPQLDTTDNSTSIFNMSIKKLVDLISDGKRFKKTNTVDERQEFLYDLLLQSPTYPELESAQRAECQKKVLKRQLGITDALLLGPGIDLLLETLQLIVDRKKWHCKFLLRNIMLLNKSDFNNGNEKGFIEKTKQMVQSLLNSGACTSLKESERKQTMLGLSIYFQQTADLSPELKTSVVQMFKEWTQDGEFKT